MTTTPPSEFGQVRYDINANSTSAPGQATPATLTSSARHPLIEQGSAAGDPNPEVSERGLAPELVAINPAGQLPTESTVVSTENPTPHWPTQVQQANVEASVQPTPTVIDGPPT
ncbi:hypothetical protein ACOSP7_005008 [Xanthoceras sorbifolium]